MAQKLFVRAPFEAVAGSAAEHYTVTADFDTAQRTTVQVNGENLARLHLQPVFPGKLTFKPEFPGTIPEDPSKPDAAPVKGDLFLELSEHSKELGHKDNAPSFAYGLLFVYLGVTLTSSFFRDTVVKVLKGRPKEKRSAAELSRLFAQGLISVDIVPKKDSVGHAFPAVQADPATKLGAITLVLGTRSQSNPDVSPPLLASPDLKTSNILASPAFVPFPVPYFFRMLRHLKTWNKIAAKDNDTHRFYEALDNREAGASPSRWRRLRVFAPGERPATPKAQAAFDGVSVRAIAVAAPHGPMWGPLALNRLGEVFVRRPDGESFRLEVRDAGG